MSMLSITRDELLKYDALTPSTNHYIKQVVDTIPSPDVPEQMKAVIAVAQLTNFAAQFRRNIKLVDDTEVPINAISFALADSGVGKDSSVNAARKCFAPGFELIEAARDKYIREEAIKAADAAGEEMPSDYAIYKSYMKSAPPIDIAPTTGPGLVKHITEIADLPLTSGFMYSGEFSTELGSSSTMGETIKILSELYDLGIKQATYTKGVEHRTGEVNGQPVSALLIGSPVPILYDLDTKKRFELEFMSKLARRSWFCYAPNKIPLPDFSNDPDPIASMRKFAEDTQINAKQARVAVAEMVKDITVHNLKHLNQPIHITEEVFHLFEVYKRYNNELADTYLNQHTTYCLIRRHLQWKALKLAGAFALMDKRNDISATNYVDAMRFCELLDSDMNRFEQALNKSYHERFSDYIRTLLRDDGKVTINIHDIKKHGFVTSVSKQKLQELVTLCAGYDPDGIYTVVNDGAAIQYEPIIKTDIIGISFKPIDNTALNLAIQRGDKAAATDAKARTATTANRDFTVGDTTFADLATMLENDYAFSPFRFANGERGRDKIIGGTKWLVFDVDDSPLSIHETHVMLSDINHHIALSSDPSNEYKYRILIELDASVELSPIAWKTFCASIANDLAIRVDPLPQAQIFYSYANRLVLSQLDAEPLAVRDYVMEALDKEINRTTETVITPKQAKAMLADKLTTFDYAYEARNGEGSRSLIRAAYHAKDLGCTAEEVRNLILDINEYWYAPLEHKRLENILNQIERMY